MPQHWLMKTEPESFSIDDLAASPEQTTFWDGVRNYQARNYMRAMRLGDRVLFYHSNAEPPAIVGTATVVRLAYPDPTAWDPDDKHFDPRSKPTAPVWDMVDIRLEQVFSRPLSLESLRAVPALARMELLRRGSRLSVQPVSPEEFAAVLGLAGTTVAAGVSAARTAAKTAPRRKPAGAKKPPARGGDKPTTAGSKPGTKRAAASRSAPRKRTSRGQA